MLTRQASAPPLGQRSPSNIQYPPPSLLATYSSTNSGGSSNGITGMEYFRESRGGHWVRCGVW